MKNSELIIGILGLVIATIGVIIACLQLLQIPIPPIPPTSIPPTNITCFQIYRTGMGQSQTVNVDVPKGYIQYLWAQEVNGNRGLTLIKASDYKGQLTLTEGGYSSPVLINSACDMSLQQQVAREIDFNSPPVLYLNNNP